jgi:hypothetical protein
MASRVERPPDFTIDDDDDFEPNAKDSKKDDDDDSSEFLANLLADRGDRKEEPRQKKRGSNSREDFGSSSWMDKNERFDTSENTDARFANNDLTPRTGRRGVPDKRREREGSDRFRERDGPNRFRERDGPNRFKERDEPKHFKEDFRGTRVFVQNLPMDATWQDVSSH